MDLSTFIPGSVYTFTFYTKDKGDLVVAAVILEATKQRKERVSSEKNA